MGRNKPDQGRLSRWAQKCCPCLRDDDEPHGSGVLPPPERPKTPKAVESEQKPNGVEVSLASPSAASPGIDSRDGTSPNKAIPDETSRRPAIPSLEEMWEEALKRVESSKADSKIVSIIQGFAKKSAEDTNSISKSQTLADIRKSMEQAISDREKDHEDMKLKISINGKEYNWRGFVEKAIAILNRLAVVPDIAVSADPIHAALPWAAVRLVLMACSASSKLRSDISFGLTKVTALIFQCDTYQRLYTAPSTSSDLYLDHLSRLINAIVKCFTHSLLFLGFAYQQCGTSSATALFKLDDVGTYTQNLIDIGNELVQAANHCEECCSHENQAKVTEVFQLATEMHEAIHNQGRLIVDIHQYLLLSELDTAKGAEYDSIHNAKKPRCCRDTRVDLLDAIQAWFYDPKGKPIYWLRGKAGTGKSTISLTVAEKMDAKGELGASFFFNRTQGGDRSRAQKFFTTISNQLCHKQPLFAQYVEEAIAIDKEIVTKAPSKQLQELITAPLSAVGKKTDGIWRILIVVDALDECDDDEHVETIITVLKSVKYLEKDGVYLKLFITSRLETHIRLRFDEIPEFREEVALHEITQGSIQQDIYTYLTQDLAEIRDKYNKQSRKCKLPEDWPGEENVKTLAELATPLFIFASTVCRFLRRCPTDGLAQVLGQARNTHDHELDFAYRPVLQRLIKGEENSTIADRVVEKFHKVVGSIVLLEEPLSIPSLALLLTIDEDKIMDIIEPIDSVLDIPAPDTNIPVKIFHLSFREFLIDKNRNKETRFYVDEEKTHGRLAIKCLELLLKPGILKKDICGLNKLGKRKKDIQPLTIRDNIPPATQYACRYWIRHLVKGKVKIDKKHQAYQFLQHHFLHWLEVLSFIGRLSEATGLIQELQNLIDTGGDDEFRGFLIDANRFILHSYAAIDRAPLQLYSSALIFAPEHSLVRKLFQGQHTGWVKQKPTVDNNWNPCLQTLEAHRPGVMAVAVSANGKMIASAGADVKARIWDAATRALRCELGPHSNGVYSVAFSSDSKMIASGSWGGEIKVWDAQTGGLQHTLDCENANRRPRTSLAFSKTGLLAGSSKYVIKVWGASTGKLEKTLQDHTDQIESVAFCGESTLLASGARDETIKIWDAATGKLQTTLTGHSDWVGSVAFSSDGRLLASASHDKTIRIWNAATWGHQHTIQIGNTDVYSVAFSIDNTLLASGLSDNTVKIWDPTTQELRYTLEGHTKDVSSVAFLNEKDTVISGSQDGTVKIWDISQKKIREDHENRAFSTTLSSNGSLMALSLHDEQLQVWDAAEESLIHKFEGDGESACSVAFSPDNKLIAVGSNNGQIQVWDAAGGSPIHTLKVDYGSLAFSPDNKLIAIGSLNGTVGLWDAAEWTLIRTLKDHHESVCSIAFSPDNKLVASGSEYGTVVLWDVAKGTLLQKFPSRGRYPKVSASSTSSHFIVNPGNMLIDASAYLHGGSSQITAGADNRIVSIGPKLLDTGSDQAQDQSCTTTQFHGYGLSVGLDWIMEDGDEAIWIHPDYRPRNSMKSWAISPQRKIIAIITKSGKFFQIGF